ncbi:uncharacterized protein LOC108135215 [Drosophila elegans]|uniref:uncharacterized protein LOC108135215 n=1 Tax=Drosophila elegans TaxID=30023 RepID=UPI0007E7203A|nr:uncharacterized protein LOC108135215 [Drosophila elegans]
MVGNKTKKLVVLLLGLDLAILLRIIIYFSFRYSSFKITTDVISYFCGLTSTIFIIKILFWVSISFLSLTADWIVVGYIPVLVYVLNWTYFTFSQRLQLLKKNYELYMDGISQKWLNNFNYNATDMSVLEKTLQCCGLEGPRSYMSYLRTVPKHCFNPELITLGCSYFIENTFYPMQEAGILVFRLTLFVELIILSFYTLKVYKKIIGSIGKHKKQIFSPHCS